MSIASISSNVASIGSHTLSSNQIAPDGDSAKTEALETSVQKRAEAQNGGFPPAPATAPSVSGSAAESGVNKLA